MSSGVAQARPAGAATAEPMPKRHGQRTDPADVLCGPPSGMASPSPISDLLLSASFGSTVRNGE